ncbi:hypothetical protein PR003_g19115 [Phytophthora rubi]|uniref:ABC transporter domain-containing protein n=1 Tax=Phytophthora rubi TaxID=129364 RepID=A0A6A4EAS6_9STRA|nr:hypothetical protein PR003_g19115 [Phytophthora rubi]
MPDLHIPVSPSVDVVYSALDSEPNTPTLTAEKKTINPCTLSWCNLIYTVDVKKSTKHPDGKKTILTNVTGRCAPGELTAVMGPSGSGKTTLLDILADRISSGTIEGSISLNGEKRNAKTFRAVSSYVAQEDSLMGSFTVSETLEMAARLSLPSIITRAVASYNMLRVTEKKLCPPPTWSRTHHQLSTPPPNYQAQRQGTLLLTAANPTENPRELI